MFLKKNRLHIILGLTFLLLLSGFMISGNQVLAEDNHRTLIMDEQNLGYPSVYTVSRRGRGYLLTSFIFDTLTWKDADGIVPLLAENWESSEDNLTWTFNLTEDAYFTDGEKLTASDVKFSFEYIMDNPHPWVSLHMIDDIELIDDYTVEFQLKDKYAPFITDVAGNVPIMPEHIWSDVTEPEEFLEPEAVIGSGPFRLKNYDSVSGTYVYEANTDYFLGEPVIDELIFTEVSDAAMALQNGNLDAAQRISKVEAERLENEGFNVKEGPGFWVYRMYLNFSRPSLDDVSVRQALYYAIDREAIVDRALLGDGEVGNSGHIHPDSEWYYPDVKEYEQSFEKANEILDDAGIVDSNDNGIRDFNGEEMNFDLVVSGNAETAEIIKSNLEEIGIKISIQSVDRGTLSSLISEGNFDLALNGHGSFGGDPVLLSRFVSDPDSLGFTPEVTDQGGEQWINDEFNEIYEKQIREYDFDTRYELAGDLQKIIAEELPTLTLYYNTIHFAYDQDKLNGWFFTKDGVALAVPTVQNKLVYIRGEWGK